MVATNLGQFFPDRVQGIHLSFPGSASEFSTLSNAVSYFIGKLLPNTFFTEEEIKHDVPKKYSLPHFLWVFWSGLGYFHLQVCLLFLFITLLSIKLNFLLF